MKLSALYKNQLDNNCVYSILSFYNLFVKILILNMDISRMKRVGTREDVYKGFAIRTAGGLKREDIIEKQFGTRTLYISKKLSDKMRTNFNIIRENNPNYFKRNPKKTLVAPKPIDDLLQTTNIQLNGNGNASREIILEQKRKTQPKTHKLSFRVKENTVRNVFYPELQGMNIKELKEELAREEAEEDKGIQLQPKKEFSIEEMPDIDIMALD